MANNFMIAFKKESGTLSISGSLSFENCKQAFFACADKLTMIDDCAKITLDLDGLYANDSSVMALLTEIARKIRSQNKEIELKNIPDKVKSISEVVSLDLDKDLKL